MATSEAITYGDEQSIRILPSQSSVMNGHVGSTGGVQHGEVEPEPLGDGAPVRHRRATQRIGADVHAGVADGVDVEHVLQVADVAGDEVVVAGGVGVLRRLVVHPLHVGQPAGQDVVGPAAITEVASLSAGPPLGGLYLKPPSRGGLWLGVTTMPSASRCRALAVRLQDGVRDGGGRGVAVAESSITVTPLAASTSSAVAVAGPDSACVSAPEEQRPVGALSAPVFADGLGDRQDVVLVEGGVQARAAVPGGPEGHPLVEVAGVGRLGVVGGDQVGDVDQVGGWASWPPAGGCVLAVSSSRSGTTHTVGNRGDGDGARPAGGPIAASPRHRTNPAELATSGR